MRLAGKNSVLERLRSDPASISKIYYVHGQSGIAPIRKKAQQHKVPLISVAPTKMQKMGGRDMNTQGVIAVVHEYEYADYNELLEQTLKKRKTLVFLDSVTDPQNLGAILRSLGCLGGFAVVLPTHDSVGVTEAVLRVASGGENLVPVVRVANLAKAIRKAKKEFVSIVGTVVKEGIPLETAEFNFPIGLVMGSEQKGLRPVIQDLVDMSVTIPMSLERMSFNVAHATTILAYEITCHKKNRKEKSGSGA